MDPILALIISGIVSILVAYLTAQQKTKTELNKERARANIEVIMRQKHDYFYPFKHNADEFRGRLGHICQRLVDDPETSPKRKNMIIRMSQNFDSKDHEWFYSDSLDQPGGYFITSTVYLNCMLFYWIKRIQHEQPFMALDISNVGSNERVAYQNLEKKHKFVQPLAGDACDIYDFTKSIRVAIALEKGIPFGLHDAIGDSLYDRERKFLANYSDFCEQLLDEYKRVKLKPVLDFWTNIVDENGDIDKERIKKIRNLHTILNMLKFVQIRQDLS